MKPTVKVWPVPRLTQEQLKELRHDIVRKCRAYVQLRVENADDVIIGLTPDATESGLGTDLVVEIGVPYSMIELSGRAGAAELNRRTISIEIGQTVKEFFKRHGFTTVVQCQDHTIFGIDLI